MGWNSGDEGTIISMKVSVIIPNFNYARYLDAAIESVLSQSYRNIELIVVNNGSTDDSLKVLEKYGDKIRIVNQSNLGQSGARNSGLNNATGDFIAFLDADDFWEPTKLEKQLNLINESTQLVYCGILPFNEGKSREMDAILPKYKGQCMKYFLDLPAASVVLSGESTALFSRNLLNRVGVFNGRLNSAAGWDFFRRCSRITEFDYINEALVHYRIHDKNMSHSVRAVVSDIECAYSIALADKEWQISEAKKLEIRISLETSFVKTYIKNLDLLGSLLCSKRLLKLYLRSYRKLLMEKF